MFSYGSPPVSSNRFGHNLLPALICDPPRTIYAEMFCTGTMGELAGVTSVDGRPIGNGETGPLTRRLVELFQELTASEGVTVV